MWPFPYLLSGLKQKHIMISIFAPACKWLIVTDSLDIGHIIFVSKNPLMGENHNQKDKDLRISII